MSKVLPFLIMFIFLDVSADGQHKAGQLNNQNGCPSAPPIYHDETSRHSGGLGYGSDRIAGRNKENNPARPKFLHVLSLKHYYDARRKPYKHYRHLTSLEVKGESNHLAMIGKINYAQRLLAGEALFRQINMQYQLDAYPIINDNNYFYLSYAYSGSKLFPNHQTRAVFYHNFPHAIETSLGAYLMQWETSFPIFTGSVGKYLEHYWISLRPYLVYREKSLTPSYTLFVRRYLDTPRHFLTLILGYGSSPADEVYAIDFQETYDLRSFNFQLNYQRYVGDWIARMGVGLKHEEYKDDSRRNRYRIEMGLSYSF
jgi:YaiO family outer membrane protein